jgi:hypothetical protein
MRCKPVTGYVEQVCVASIAETYFSNVNKKAGSFDPAIQNSQPLTRPDEPAQPAFFAGSAFFTNATFGVFFSIAFFNSSARGDSTSALALIRNASSPPR